MRGDEFDVLVIGEGVSGITAAAAACQQGARVMLVSKGPVSFVLGTACVDLEGLNESARELCHCSASEIETAIGFFLDLTAAAGCAYEGGVRERRLVPTIMGTFAEVSLASRQLWKGDPRGAGHAMVVGVENMFAFDADFVAERLSAHSEEIGLTTSYRSAVIRLPQIQNQRWLTSLEIASEVDRNVAYCQALVAALKSVAGDADLLIIPGVLGLNSDDDDIRHIEDEIECGICELATMPPSVPGLRLLRRMESYLAANGVEICTGFSVQKLCIDSDHCTGVVLDTPGKPRTVHAGTVVLAAGRFSNLLLDCAAEGPASDLLPRVSEDLRPVSSNGAVLADNIFECGSLLGKFESRHGNAIAIISGYQAGMLVCQRGVHYAKS